MIDLKLLGPNQSGRERQQTPLPGNAKTGGSLEQRGIRINASAAEPTSPVTSSTGTCLLLAIRDLRPPISPVNAYDNALAETTIGLYKHECIRAGSPFRRGPLERLADVEQITADWVHCYNTSRLMHRLDRRRGSRAGWETAKNALISPRLVCAPRSTSAHPRAVEVVDWRRGTRRPPGLTATTGATRKAV